MGTESDRSKAYNEGYEAGWEDGANGIYNIKEIRLTNWARLRTPTHNNHSQEGRITNGASPRTPSPDNHSQRIRNEGFDDTVAPTNPSDTNNKPKINRICECGRGPTDYVKYDEGTKYVCCQCHCEDEDDKLIEKLMDEVSVEYLGEIRK